jgi:hypothetical protein
LKGLPISDCANDVRIGRSANSASASSSIFRKDTNNFRGKPRSFLLVFGAQRSLQERLPFLAVVEQARDGLLKALLHLAADDPNPVLVLYQTHANVHAWIPLRDTTSGTTSD